MRSCRCPALYLVEVDHFKPVSGIRVVTLSVCCAHGSA
jgi:hypothetical protein